MRTLDNEDRHTTRSTHFLRKLRLPLVSNLISEHPISAKRIGVSSMDNMDVIYYRRK